MTGKKIKLLVKIGAALALALLLLCASALAYLEFADLGSRLALLETMASRAVGREVKIDGPLTLDLGRTVEIKAGRIRLANASWSAEPSMLDIRDVHLVLETGSLFSGPLRFTSITIPQASIIFHRDAKQGLNWILKPRTAEKDVGKPALADATLPLIVDHLDATQISLLFRGPNLEKDVPMVIGTLSINESELGALDIAASGMLSNRPWVLTGDLGTVATLVSGRQIKTTLQMDFNSARLGVSAGAGDLSDLRDVRLDIQFSGQDLLAITRSLGLPEVARGEFQLNSQLRAGPDQLQATLDASAGGLFADLDLDARQLGSGEPLVDAEIRANGPNLGAVASLLGLPGLEEKPFTISGKLHREKGNTLFDNIVLDAPGTRAALSGEITQPPGYVGTRLDLQLNIPSTGFISTRFGLEWLKPGPAVLTASLAQSDSGLSLPRAELTMGSTRLAGSGTIGNLETLHGTRLALDLESPDARGLGQSLGQSDWPDLPINALAELEIADGNWRLGNLKAQLGKATIIAGGFLGSGPEAIQADMDLEVDFPSMEPIGNKLGLPSLPDLPLRGSAKLTLAGQKVRLDTVALELGVLSVTGTAEAEHISDTGYQLDSTLVARGGNFRKAASLAGFEDAPELPWKAGARLLANLQSLRLENLDMELGDSRLQGRAEYWMEDSRSHVAVQARGPDARPLHKVLQQRALQPLPFTLAADLTLDSQGVLLQEARGTIAGLSVESSGTLGNWPELEGSSLVFSLDTPDLASSARHWSEAAAPAAPFKLTGQLGKNDGEVILNADSQIGEDILTLEGRMGSGKPRNFTIRASGTELNLNKLGELWPAPPPAAKAKADKTTRLIPDIKFPQTWPDNLAGHATLDVKSLHQGERHFLDVHVEASLDSQALEIPVARARLGEGTLSATVKARPVEQGIHVETRISGTDVKVAVMPASAGITTRPPVDSDISLSGAGTGLRELAGNLDGNITLSHGKGAIANSAITSDFLAELARLLNPLRQADAPTVLQCGLVVMKVNQGMVTTDIAMDQTSRLLITALATANLKNEQIEVLFTIMNREGIGVSATSIVNPYVKITGTLARPTLSFAPTRAAISYGAAVASGGLSVLAKGVWDRLASSGQQCEKELARRKLRLPGT